MTKRTDTTAAAPSIDLCAHANLRKAMRVVSQTYDAALKPSGLKGTQFTLLAVLDKRGEISLTKLSEILVMDRTTLTRNLQPLLKHGWIAIGRDSDERVRLITITGAGRERVAAATPAWQATQARLAGELGEQRLATLIADLGALTDAARPA